MEIFPFGEEDVFALSKLLQYESAERGKAGGGMTETLMRAVRSEEVRFFIVKEGDFPVGFSAFTLCYDYALGNRVATLEHLYLMPDFRGKGYGKAILSYVENAARYYGATALQIRGEEGKMQAFGFTPTTETVYKKNLT